MVDVLALDKWSSGERLDFRKDSPVRRVRYQHDSLSTANGSIGNDQEWRRFLPMLRDWVNSVVSANPQDRVLPKAILEDIKPNGWRTEYSEHIDQLGRLPIDWDSYGSNLPNFIATRTAREILDSLWDIVKPPYRVAPLADEGVVVWLMLDNRRISIESLNSGTTVLEINKSDGSLERIYENKSPTEIADILRSFFSQTEFTTASDVPSSETGESELPTE